MIRGVRDRCAARTSKATARDEQCLGVCVVVTRLVHGIEEVLGDDDSEVATGVSLFGQVIGRQEWRCLTVTP